MRRKYPIFALVLALIMLTAAVAWTAKGEFSEETRQLRRLERTIGVELSSAVLEEYEDDHGGFHGDGVLTAVVTFSSQEEVQEFANSLPDTWRQLPVENGLLGTLRTVWSDLPQVERGFWFYRDRYQEQYGKVSSYNRYLQNATFALLDTETGRLYVLKVDF